LTDIVLLFEVHQPYRLKKGFFWERNLFHRLRKEELFSYYFDDPKNREIFERACRKCYFPSNEILLRLIDESKSERKRVKVSFSISGVFLEQCEAYSPDLLESFRQLGETGCVEFLCQTHYHSLAGLYPTKEEFTEQILKHRQALRDLLGAEPSTFENTELLYNNAIAKVANQLGFTAIFTEGVDRILKGRSPDYVYRARGCDKTKVLLRNYKLTDDIGFRFSLRSWNEWPLTADKYAAWLAATKGQCVSVFPDYETFGEHHWPETGIHDFLRHLPREILNWQHLQMSMPSEVVSKHKAVGEIDVPELSTVSWADLERDTSCWLGNTMQWAYYTETRELEPLVKESKDEDLLRIWRYLLTSDHLYYMFTAGGAPGEVHSYFSPYNSAADAFVTAQAVILDFESRLRLNLIAANEPFLFNTGPGEEGFIGVKAWGLVGMADALRRVNVESLEFHNERGDFGNWASLSLRDEELAKKLEEVRASGAQGEELRQGLYDAVSSRLAALKELVRASTRSL